MNLYTYRDSVVHRSNPVIPLTKDVQKKIMGKTGKNLPEVLPIKNPIANDTIIKIRSNTPVLTEQTWDNYYKFLNQNLNQFKRRSFEEFSYLTVEPSAGAVIFVYILALILAIGVNIWVINNEFDEDSPGGRQYMW